jgi:L-rhamnose isomerase
MTKLLIFFSNNHHLDDIAAAISIDFYRYYLIFQRFYFCENQQEVGYHLNG